MTSQDDAAAGAWQGLWKRRKVPTASRAYRCQCGRPVFFRNSTCLACQTPLGFEPHRAQVLPLAPGEQQGLWTLQGDTLGALYRRCQNFHSAIGCNWLVPVPTATSGRPANPKGLCVACNLNRMIPDQDDLRNRVLWRDTEVAKRRLVSQLLALGLPVASRVNEDPLRGLAFDLLHPTPDKPQVLTGHADGIITLNVEEADSAMREQVRTRMREPYRTLLGHFRHEVGHYYWDRLVRDTDWHADFRDLFGDERQDYAAALRNHYEQGPPTAWAQRYISGYASTHPWEDWAESWAHYLHIADAVDTALSFGLDADDVEIDHAPFGPEVLWLPHDPGAAPFLEFINAWVQLTRVLNELSRSMGQPDFYPFVLPRAVVGKLQFIHVLVSEARSASNQNQNENAC
ncbi:MAG: putative zinc-binding metallopeptidase [Burkholderiaceae bacterium]|nr:putative zinc-binding metallopeptidase [Burkholderiaceae bacterium]MDZ4143156.1 putative zinc-binding metallopeptidase [Burkholderiales bacterium]